MLLIVYQFIFLFPFAPSPKYMYAASRGILFPAVVSFGRLLGVLTYLLLPDQAFRYSRDTNAFSELHTNRLLRLFASRKL